MKRSVIKSICAGERGAAERSITRDTAASDAACFDSFFVDCNVMLAVLHSLTSIQDEQASDALIHPSIHGGDHRLNN